MLQPAAVERRMVPSSKDTAEIILLFGTFENHLDGGNKTIDLELEKKTLKQLEKSWLKYVQNQLLTVMPTRKRASKSFSPLNRKNGK